MIILYSKKTGNIIDIARNKKKGDLELRAKLLNKWNPDYKEIEVNEKEFFEKLNKFKNSKSYKDFKYKKGKKKEAKYLSFMDTLKAPSFIKDSFFIQLFMDNKDKKL